MYLKDLFPILISLTALAIAGYNLYAQQFRKRDRLIGYLVLVSVNEGEFDTFAEYSLANIGDTQLLIKRAWVLCSDADVQLHIHSSCPDTPCVLKPGDISVFKVLYDRKQIEEELRDGESCCVEFEVLSPKGTAHYLSHHFQGEGVTQESKWKAFELQEAREQSE